MSFRIPRLMLLRVLFTLVLMLAIAAVASACPNCKDALAANDPTHSGVVKGYFYSILFMMGTPFAIIGGFSLYMYRQVQRAREERAVKEPPGSDSVDRSAPTGGSDVAH
jgi:hypothetical protein